jgi:hypothetical protein
LGATGLTLAIVLIAGCVAVDQSSPAPSEIAGDENERPTPSPTVIETAEPTDPTLTSTPVDIDCNSLLSLETVYEFNPNVGIDPAYMPTARGAEALAYGGVSCGWINQTSGDSLAVSVAQFDASSLLDVQEIAREREGATLVGPDNTATIRTVNGVGSLELFVDSYWICIESRMIVEYSDASLLIDEISSALR